MEINDQSVEDLLPRVYDELRSIAAKQMGHWSPSYTIQPTALVHEHGFASEARKTRTGPAIRIS